MARVPKTGNANDIDGAVILRAIEAQHGILVGRAKSIYAFSHLTFHEYFTAQYIVANEARRATKGLIRDHLTDDRWREVFLLTSSMLGDADEFFREIRQAIDGLVVDNDAIIRLLTWATDKATTSPRYSAPVARALWLFFAFIIDRALDPTRALDLDYEQTEQVNAYLRATQLLVDCLKVATVSNREEIKESLLLPPTAS